VERLIRSLLLMGLLSRRGGRDLESSGLLWWLVNACLINLSGKLLGAHAV